MLRRVKSRETRILAKGMGQKGDVNFNLLSRKRKRPL
jgi:hypothetical protein